jgi:hypothetical protein
MGKAPIRTDSEFREKLRERTSFFEKKKQKNFCSLGARVFQPTMPKGQKFFGSFFQKRTACLV